MVKCNQFPGELLNLELLESRLICFRPVKFRTNVHEMQIVGHEYLHIHRIDDYMQAMQIRSHDINRSTTMKNQSNKRFHQSSHRWARWIDSLGSGNPSKMTRR